MGRLWRSHAQHPSEEVGPWGQRLAPSVHLSFHPESQGMGTPRAGSS